MYQAGPETVAEQINKEAKANRMNYHFSVDEARDVIKEYFKAFKGLKQWIDENKTFIGNNGYVYSHFGRKPRTNSV